MFSGALLVLLIVLILFGLLCAILRSRVSFNSIVSVTHVVLVSIILRVIYSIDG